MTLLDHVVVNTLRNMDAAYDQFAALGFTLTPRGYHSLGSINHLMMTRGAYLELVGVPEQGLQRQDILESPYGLNGLVFRSDDADVTFADLTASGFQALAPVAFSRPVTIDGRTLDARFRTVRLPAATFSGGRVYFCEHLTPELVWREEWLSHPNGFCGLDRFVIEAKNAEYEAELYAKASQSSVETWGLGWRVPLADAQIDIVESATARFATVHLVFESLDQIEHNAGHVKDAEWRQTDDKEATLFLPELNLTLACRGIR